MQTHDLSGGFEDIAVGSASAFRAALNAMARPGRIQKISGAKAPRPCSEAAASLLVTLVDFTTPLHLAGGHDSPEMRAWVTFHTNAPLVGPEAAQFALGTWQSLAPLERYSIGTPEYPDRSATLIIECAELEEAGARLTGPGIKEAHHLNLPDVKAFQHNHALFPLGLDFHLTCGDRVAGLPRSTKVEAL